MSLYFVPPASASLSQQPEVNARVACRCCPGGISRDSRPRRYPLDMSDAEWTVTEPLLSGPGWQRGQGGSPRKRCRAGWCTESGARCGYG